MKRKKAMKSIIKNNNIPIKLMLLAILVTLGCERQEIPLPAAKYPNTAEVFMDGFSAGLEYAAFGDSKVTAFAVDENVSFEDVILSSSMRFDIPYEGDPEGPYAGGIFRDLGGRDLSEYNALTFYAQGSKTGTIDQIGFGNDFLGDQYSTSTSINLNTSWTKYILPIPDPSKLTQEKGLFLISEGPEEGEGYSIWVDQVKFENLGTIAQPRAAMLGGNDVTQKTFIGSRAVVSNLTYTVNLPNGADQTVGAAPAYFSFASSDTLVAKVSDAGLVSVVGEGTAVITATLGELDVAGSLTLESLGEFTAAPTPPQDAADVISIFSNAYDNVPVEYYNGFWGGSTTLGGADIEINGDVVIKYSQLNYVGTQFSQPTVDASAMTHFHIDIQVEDDMEDGDFIRLELNDFGPDGAFGGGDDTGGSITFTSPSLETGTWASLDIPLSGITGLTSTANMAQIIFVSDATISNILVDNMYFYKDDGGGGTPVPPTSPAPTPSQPEADVISIYSDAYTDVPNSGYNNYGAAAFEEVDISGDKSLKYTFVAGDGGNFQVIELGGDNQIDAAAAGMTNFRFDAWFPNAVDGSSTFLLKLVDIGAATTEGSVNVGSASNPVMEQGKWLSFDIPFTELESSGLGGKANIQQIVIDLMNSGEVYVDNIYMYKSGGSGECQAETSQSLKASDFDMTFQTDPGSVIGSFGGAYTYLDNPDFDNSVNPSCKVGQIARDGQQFANTQIEFDSKFDFNANSGFKLKVWSPTSGTNVLVKLEDKANPEINNEVSAVTSTANAWEELTFDFAPGESGKYDKIILFFELDSDVVRTYYIDDFRLYGSGGGTCQAETSQSLEASDFDMTFQTDPGSLILSFGGTYTYLDNPDFDNSVNPSCKVGQIARDGQQFANTQIEFDSKFDFNTNSGFKLKVWSPTSGTNVLVKLEDKANPEINNEVSAVTSTANAWEELTFDFAPGESGKYDKIILFFELDSDVVRTYYIDDFRLYGSGGGGAAAPTDAPAAPPTRDAEDVISIYGEAYGAEVGLANVDWDDGSTFVEETIAGNKLLKIDFADFLGTQLNSVVDATAMTNFHMDVWIADDFEAGQIFNPKWSNHAGGAGETNAFELTKAIGDTDAKKWLSIDVPITDFTGDATRAELAAVYNSCSW
jgi:hypothetical protein